MCWVHKGKRVHSQPGVASISKGLHNRDGMDILRNCVHVSSLLETKESLIIESTTFVWKLFTWLMQMSFVTMQMSRLLKRIPTIVTSCLSPVCVLTCMSIPIALQYELAVCSPTLETLKWTSLLAHFPNLLIYRVITALQYVQTVHSVYDPWQFHACNRLIHLLVQADWIR